MAKKIQNAKFRQKFIAQSFSFCQIFIHLSKSSSIYDDSMQNLDESATLFISLVPHA
jgi:hypothetical protein